MEKKLFHHNFINNSSQEISSLQQILSDRNMTKNNESVYNTLASQRQMKSNRTKSISATEYENIPLQIQLNNNQSNQNNDSYGMHSIEEKLLLLQNENSSLRKLSSVKDQAMKNLKLLLIEAQNLVEKSNQKSTEQKMKGQVFELAQELKKQTELNEALKQEIIQLNEAIKNKENESQSSIHNNKQQYEQKITYLVNQIDIYKNINSNLQKELQKRKIEENSSIEKKENQQYKFDQNELSNNRYLFNYSPHCVSQLNNEINDQRRKQQIFEKDNQKQIKIILKNH